MKHREWSTDDTVERMEACRQSMIADTNRTLDVLDQLEADFAAAGAGIDDILEKLRWVTL